jgi:hypothetical protein
MVLEPVSADVVGVSAFGEQLSPRVVLGAALILLAVVVIGRTAGERAATGRWRAWRRRPVGVAVGASVVPADIAVETETAHRE